MKISFVTQRSPEWKAIRRGIFTASELGPFITNTGKVAEGARQKLVRKKLGEMAGDEDDDYQSPDMKRGVALEHIVKAEYARLSGYHLHDCGFIMHDTYPFGASPDSLILRRPLAEDEDAAETIPGLLAGGVELKCPRAFTQEEYLLGDWTLPDSYVYQVHTTLAVTGLPWWDFFTLCPLVEVWEKTWDAWTAKEWSLGFLPPFYVRVYRSEITASIEREMPNLTAEREAMRQKIAAIKQRGFTIPPL